MLKLTGAVLLLACSICMQGSPGNPTCQLGTAVFGLLGLALLGYGLVAERQKPQA